jgi:hypothetical protein
MHELKVKLSYEQVNEILDYAIKNDEIGGVLCDFAAAVCNALPTYECDASDSYVKVDTAEDFAMLVKCMGYATVDEFEHDTGVSVSELLGKYWCTVRGRIYTR